MKKWIANLEKISFKKSKYSQYYQADLLEYIFDNLEVNNNEAPMCVEFGYNSQFISPHANTTSLILDQGWKNIYFDGSYENKDINLYKEFLTTKNIKKIFHKYNIKTDIEYISIDVDSTDLWLFNELLSEFRPKVYSVEYNPNFPIDVAITLVNNSSHFFENDKAYGASLKALNIVAKKNNYSLLWVVPTLDAFFIRNDLIEDGTTKIVYPFSKWKKVTNIPVHPPTNNKNRLNNLIDYELYLNNNEDIKLAKMSGKKVVKKYISKRGNIKTKYIYLKIKLSNIIRLFLVSNKVKKFKLIHKVFQKLFIITSPFPYDLDIHKLR